MAITLAKNSDVAVILIDNPPVNAIAHTIRIGLVDALYQANEDTSVVAIVIASAGDTFSAGADVREFDAPTRAPALGDVSNAIELSNKPVVAAIHGAALGGGFEFALSAHARIADAGARLGLPEVKLGLIPGGGGTQRLPRLAGFAAAVDLVATGREIGAHEALQIGVIDRIADEALFQEACTLARSLAGRMLRRTSTISPPPFGQDAIEKTILDLGKRARGQDAPTAGARMVMRAACVPFQDALREELALFNTLKTSDEAKSLRYVFGAERAARKHADLDHATPRPVHRIGVVGGGLMGAGITIAFAIAGFRVELAEQNDAAAASATEKLNAGFARMARSGRLTEPSRADALSRIGVSGELRAVQHCDLIIEAVYDDLAVKQSVLSAITSLVGADAIIATNTSYLDPNVLAQSVAGPQRFAGMHFFSPANLMRLVEVVRTDSASSETLATLLALSKRLGKVGVVAGSCEGFIGNRIFTAYRRECDFMLEDGALPHEVDAALEAFGYPMGPYAANDLAGLDISWARRKRGAASRDPSQRYVAIADKLCEQGRFGQKSGKGYYRYEGGRRLIDDDVITLIEDESRAARISRRTFTPDEIVTRVMRSIVDEGRRLLAEGIAARASDIDLVLIHGYGYPAWRGGPMYRAGVH